MQGSISRNIRKAFIWEKIRNISRDGFFRNKYKKNILGKNFEGWNQKVQGFISWNIRKAFFGENIKAFLWENIQIFFNLTASSISRNIRNFFGDEFFMFFEFALGSALGSSYLYY